MSVVARIESPMTDAEKLFYRGISTEAFFSAFIEPIAEKFSLDLCEHWGSMVEVTGKDFDEFSRQMDVLKENLHADQRLTVEAKAAMDEKLTLLVLDLRPIFDARPGAVLIIG